MDEQKLPILLEGIIRLSGKDALDKIQLHDLENEKLSIQLLSKELRLFKKFMKLHLDAFAFAGQHANEWSKSDQACIAMACRVFNHLMAAAKLLVTGYWAESMVIERSAFEAITREWYFYKYPRKATSWFRGGVKGEVRQSTVRKALGDIEGDFLCEFEGVFYLLSCFCWGAYDEGANDYVHSSFSSRFHGRSRLLWGYLFLVVVQDSLSCTLYTEVNNFAACFHHRPH